MKTNRLVAVILALTAVVGVWRLYAIGCNQVASSSYGSTAPPQCEYWWATIDHDGTVPADVFCKSSPDPTDKCALATVDPKTYDVITKYHWKGTVIHEAGPPPWDRCSAGTTTSVYVTNAPRTVTVICTDPPPGS